MSDSGGGGGVGVGVQVSCGGLGPYISRLVVCTIAASCVLGLFYPTWRVVQDVDELHSPPYDPRIVTAVKYSFTAAAFNLPWGFLFCLFALLMTVDIGRGSVAFLTTFFLGAIDVVSLSFIAAATTWHWKLLGKPFKSCGEADRPYGDGTPSFFTIVGARVDKSAEGVCKDLSKAVVAEIVLM
ncbi:hypothetical protein C7999DRAFT_30587 [Corynascus novoguineensis]|uniref:Uncharacterized protein n=1 Tax=Corynascus novoguineensis TaxID=1126955 RepID=A0AAN7HRA3_9PEZI|nr:hypothetical protein C7999DRAFT_30587 [Corynascus novoguineensis]